jgi:hypothetical protein
VREREIETGGRERVIGKEKNIGIVGDREEGV